MGSVLIIAEKPDQGAKLAAPFPSIKGTGYIEIKPSSMFPNGAYVTWAIGHLCELVPPEQYDQRWKAWKLETLPIVPEKFKHQVTRGKTKQFQMIKKLANQSSVKEIIMAGDAGREGELIVRLILQQCQINKPLKRLWLSSLTANAVETGFRQLRTEEETRPLYYEALSRSCADWLVGMNASRAYTLLFKQKGINDVFSTGRVQTPTLALIVKREKEIEAFKPEPFWEVKAIFLMNGKEYEGIWHKDEQTRLKSAEQAEKVALFCKGKQAAVSNIEKEEKHYKPPYFFTLSSLQTLANQRFRFSPKQTLDIAQKLYVKGYISYPRTDSSFVTKGEANMFPAIVETLLTKPDYKQFAPLPTASLLHNKRYVNDKKVTDHYAIIPTEQVPNVEKLSNDEQKIYDLIARSLLAAHEKDAIVHLTKVETLVDGRATFQSKGKVIKQEGWRRIIYTNDQKNDDQDLPALEVEEQGIVKSVQTRESVTQPPKRYTEGQLITVMKTAGKQLTDSELEKVLMESQGLGTEATRAGILTVLKDRGYMTVTKNIVSPTEKGRLLIDALGSSILTSAEMTAKWEQRLREIGKGEASSVSFMEQTRKLVDHLIDEAKSQANNWDFSDRDLTSMQRKTRKGQNKRRVSSIGTCPNCGGTILDRGTFFGCNQYKTHHCSFTISKTLLGKKLRQKDIKAILTDGQTEVLDGFKKEGKSFQASLSWDKQLKRITFQSVK
ncbi:DNA topoisomerase III [Halalkalibacter nanhaiisediminis]|uniref:DNA topoisomerase n=1 Tax=Halalkalibacter nanhaiisediminis TaxID=688079 RepID=A0A562Q9D9_9BACI|nr:DNA topoisomerase III [Halalkalibacter nanhaiisediminis]TWI53314.1 DNA topoisomerase-3 [Halalkalibacter nanhaiisediminis]